MMTTNIHVQQTQLKQLFLPDVLVLVSSWMIDVSPMIGIRVEERLAVDELSLALHALQPGRSEDSDYSGYND